MSDDWLDRGHGPDASRLTLVFAASSADPPAPDGSARRGWRSWIAGTTSVAVITAVAMLGSAGAVYAVRETLFPSLGTPTSPSVWQNPAPPDEVALLATTTSATPATTVVALTTVAVGTIAAGGEPDGGESERSGPGAGDPASPSSGSGSGPSGPDDSDSAESGSGSGQSGSDRSGSGDDDSGSGGSGSGDDDSGSGDDDGGSDGSGSGDDDSGSGGSGSGGDAD